MAAHGPCPGPDEALVRLLLDRVRARAASGGDGVEREVPGKFDQGWDELREETFERQKRLGVIPPDAVLTRDPTSSGVGLALGERERLYARQMEVYAGYEENADWNVGRLLDAIQEMGELENTLVHLHLRR